MSTALEPQPTASVILHTTAGDLLLALFAAQTPLACRNFLQHCLDGYYANTLFHRLVPSFIIQAGDPTSTGSGGISAINNGAGFRNEYHTRLKFNRRGLLGMANDGDEGNGNGSQFFLTLAPTPELQGKNTLFGRVEGETVFNLVKMGEAECEGDRPVYPTKITGANVLVNPFEDLVPKARTEFRGVERRQEEKGRKKRRKLLGKNALSFGVELGEEEEEERAPMLKKAKIHPRVVKADESDRSAAVALKAAPEITRGEVVEPTGTASSAQMDRVGGEDDEDGDIPAPPTQRKSVAVLSKPAKLSTATSTNRPKHNDDREDEDTGGGGVLDDDDDDGRSHSQPRKGQSSLSQTNAEIAAVKDSMRRSRAQHRPQKETIKPKSALEAMIPATSTRGRKRVGVGKGMDEAGALDELKAFKQRLAELPTSERAGSAHAAMEKDRVRTGANETTQGSSSADADGEDDVCDLHFIANCLSCRAWDREDGAVGGDGADIGGMADADEGWMGHRLTFAKDTWGKDLEWRRKMEQLEVVDSRDEKGMRRSGEEKPQKGVGFKDRRRAG